MKSFKQYLIEEKDQLKGLVDFAGIQDKDKISDVVTTHGKFKHEYSNGKPCTGEKVTAGKELINLLKQETKKGYYSFLFDNSKFYVIFHDKMFTLNRKDYKKDSQYKDMVEYGKKQGIEKFYFDELGDTVWE